MYNAKSWLVFFSNTFSKAKKRIVSPDGVAICFILLVIIAFFVTKWTLQGAWFTNDLIGITTPLENLYAHIQRSGQSPLWAPEFTGGYPLLATGQLGFWYPPYMLLRQFLPAVWTLNLSLLIHSIFAGVGVFIFLRINKLNRGSAIMGAILLPLGAAFVGKYEMLNLILPLTWVPLLLALLQLFLEKGWPRFLVCWVIGNVLCIIMGHPQMAVQVLIMEAIFVLTLLALDWKRWIRGLAVLGAVFLVLCLTSSYLLPILDNVSMTNRAQGINADDKELFEFSFTPKAFIELVVPHPFGHGDQYQGPKNEAELSVYLGPVAIILGFIGLFGGLRRFPVVWLFSVFALIVGISLGLGGNSLVYRWLVHAGWRYFNVPARFFLVADFGLVFLACIGLHLIANMLKNRALRLAIAIIITALAIVPVLWVSWSWYQGVPWIYTQEPFIADILSKETGLVRIFSSPTVSDTAPHNDFGIGVWNEICSTCRYRQTFTSPFSEIRGINLRLSRNATPGVITIKVFNKGGEQARESSISADAIVDSEWNEFSFQPIEGALNQSFYFEVTSTIPKTQAPYLVNHTNPHNEQYDPTGSLYTCKKDSCEVVEAGGNTVDAAFMLITTQTKAIPEYEILSANVPVGFGVGSTQWSGSLGILNVMNYLKPIGERSAASAWQENRSLINRFPITHVIGLYPPYRYATNLVDFTEVTSIPLDDMFIRLYRNNEAFPRMQFAEHVKAIDGSGGQLKALSLLNPTNESTVVADIPKDTEFASGGNVISTEDERSRVVIQTSNAHEGFLVMRDVLLPGWTATIDGQATPIYLTDSLFRGIIIPAGKREVVFRYMPSWIRLAEILTTIALLIMAVFGWFCWKIGKR
ncbi:MAG TPA: hypothetical protein VJI96_03405 [Candidatus Andersenbacteria bacterium]|nr:hypothetical protein [Candidatus Andersenbacteria bacterium]